MISKVTLVGSDNASGSKSISNGAQYVTPENKIYGKKVKKCQFSSGNWFLCTRFVHIAMACKRPNTVVHLQKRV